MKIGFTEIGVPSNSVIDCINVFYSQVIFLVCFSLSLSETYLELRQTSTVERFCENC